MMLASAVSTPDETILVTGSSGLVGRALVEALVAMGRNVVGTDVSPNPGTDTIRLDVRDIHRLHALVREYSVTSAIHCAAISGPMVMRDNPAGIIAANVTGTTNLLEVARIHGFRRTVVCSSTSAYGATQAEDAPIGADAPLRPMSVYGASKAACDQILVGYRAQHNVDAVAVRLSWVYGPGRTTDCFIRTLIEDAYLGRRSTLPFGRGFPRQYIHVHDAVAALIAAHDVRSIARSIYNATGGDWLTLDEVAEIVRKILPQSAFSLAEGPDPVDELQHQFDIEPTWRELGFSPRISLQSGIADYANYIRAQGAVKK
jgi:UDP-glucuronate 4-epimerase